MNKIQGMKVSKEVEKLIKERFLIGDNPYEFIIKGVTGHGYDLYTTAHIALKKVEKWAIREGAEVRLIRDQYKEIANGSLEDIKELPLELRLSRLKNAGSKGQSKGYLLIEVTDPAARIMEYIIREGI